MEQNDSSESYENYTKKEKNESSLVPTGDFNMVGNCSEDDKIEKERSFKSTMILNLLTNCSVTTGLLSLSLLTGGIYKSCHQ